MDIISYSTGSKASSLEKRIRNKTLGKGIEGTYLNIDERIKNIEKVVEGVNLKANQLILNDSINIMKAHAKLNTIAKTTRYRMQNMIFDDFIDASGIDKLKSYGYFYSSSMGYVRPSGSNCTIETITETTEISPSKVILTVEESGSEQSSYLISRDNGDTWEKILPDKLFYFDDKISPKGNKIRIKIQLKSTLLSYGLTWS
ncbi:hypothetical protein O0R52_21525 (plasmid) [Bacillus halotolerans]|uniref:Uncharacterized protein n=1 Tax=Bacillus halotolerans TaxID=260554 RepID=A0ABY7I7K6_9BACI|nr:hypothetical protein [Bacillus halotolerans]WAT23579.1 hypothetical protein O0R52_21525 [Bacillus halotolerans]